MTAAPPPWFDELPRLPARDPTGHKGTFGVVAVVGGCCSAGSTMLGGPCIAAAAALRAGVGLVRLALPRPLLVHGLSVVPSATGVALPVDGEGAVVAHEAAGQLDALLAEAECVVAGPGMGVDAGAAAMALRLAGQEERPVVLDADALNALAATPSVQLDFKAQALLTPHPGEFRRLAAQLGVAEDPTDPAQRSGACAALAQKLGCVVALKGAGTVVSDGHRTWTCPAVDAALATAGTGDALAGLAGGLVASVGPLSSAAAPLDLYDCARVAVAAHAHAAALWRAAHGACAGLVAMELAELLPQALEPLRGGARGASQR